MLKSLCFSLTLLLPSISLAQSLIAVNKKMFTVGNYWVWEYKTIEGDHNSYVKYLVLAKQGSKVTFEMQSQLSGESAFKAHHRFSVDLQNAKQLIQTITALNMETGSFSQIRMESGSMLD